MDNKMLLKSEARLQALSTAQSEYWQQNYYKYVKYQVLKLSSVLDKDSNYTNYL